MIPGYAWFGANSNMYKISSKLGLFFNVYSPKYVKQLLQLHSQFNFTSLYLLGVPWSGQKEYTSCVTLRTVSQHRTCDTLYSYSNLALVQALPWAVCSATHELGESTDTLSVLRVK